MRLRPGARQRRSAAAELPLRRPRQRMPAAGVRYEPRLAAGPARRRRRARHPGRAAGAGGRLMLRDLEDLRPHEALTPRPTNSVVVRRPARMLLPSTIMFHGLVHLVHRSLEPPLDRRLWIGNADGELPLVLVAHDASSARICFA